MHAVPPDESASESEPIHSRRHLHIKGNFSLIYPLETYPLETVLLPNLIPIVGY
jgi:hypothetical protein